MAEYDIIGAAAAKVIVIVPCFNEANRLRPSKFMQFMKENPTYSFLFVDDGSTDSTAHILKSITGQCRSASLFRMPKNKGKAEAVRLGILEAMNLDCDLVAFLDADLSAPLSALIAMTREYEKRPDTLCISGARVRLLGRNIQRSIVRHYVGRIFATIIAFLFDLRIYDTQCGAKLFRNAPEIRAVFSAPFQSSWIFDVEIFLRLRRALQKQDVPLEHAAREIPLAEWVDHGKSRMHLKDFLRIPFDTLRIYLKYRNNSIIQQTPPPSPPPPSQNTPCSPA